MKVKHLLMIDDNPLDNYISEVIVTESKFAEKITTMTSAMDALQFLEKLKEAPAEEFPDMIFLDIRMPQMDGFEFLEEFKKFPQANNIHCPVIMLTSSDDKKDRDRAFQYPVVKKYITKPLETEILEKFL
jgi:CheY-like chemotaxis protein